jgi:hypothetical protein
MTACVTARPSIVVVNLNAPPHALQGRAPETVTIFTASAPTRPFVEVALIECRREWGKTETAQEIFLRLRTAAAKTGCDGLILLGEANLTSGSIWPTPGLNGPETHGDIETFEGYRATCVVWSDAGTASPAASGQPDAGAAPAGARP